MKIAASMFVLLLSLTAVAQTQVPVVLIDPGSSTSGQVITSNGPGVAPAWKTFPGIINPMTSLGDMIVGGSSGIPQRLGIASGVLSDVLGLPTWTLTPALTGTNFTGIPYSGLTGTVPTWNQNTTGNASTVTNGVYTTDTGTVTNAMLSGSIANAKLTNSSITLGSTNISLGSTASSLAGLTSIGATTFTGALTGNASTSSNLATARTIAITGDGTWSTSFDGSANVSSPLTLATVNSNTGLCADSTHVCQITVNGKGLITAATPVAITSGGAGTVTSVSVTTANGVSGTVATPTSTPAITLTLGAITPTTVAPTGAITPNTTAGIVGTTLADNANAGSVGEYVTSTATTGNLTSNVQTNVTSITLSAGDWDVTGTIATNPAGTTLIQFALGGLSTISATLPGAPFYFINRPVQIGGNSTSDPVAQQRFNVSTTTTIYLVTNVVFTTSTCTATGMIQARRVR